jgi:site-specific DNA-adenine methylase
LKNKANNYIKSPLNYIGGKYRTLPQLLSFFPQKINTFVDLFAGGLNVGLNVAANRIIFNDHNKYLVEMFTIFSKQSEEDTLAASKERINKYQLSLVNAGGYKIN